MKKKKGYFSISAVAEMFSVHQQTIRLYEKEGLICPKRSQGNTRLFSEEDIEKLEQVIYLTHQLGINLAGVDMILKLQKKIKKMQKELNKVLDSAHFQLEEEGFIAKKAASQSARTLLQLKSTSKISPPEQTTPSTTHLPQKTPTTSDWEVEYEE